MIRDITIGQYYPANSPLPALRFPLDSYSCFADNQRDHEDKHPARSRRKKHQFPLTETTVLM